MHSPANFVPAKLGKACEYSGGPESPEPEKERSHSCSSAASSRNDANSTVAMHLLFLEKYQGGCRSESRKEALSSQIELSSLLNS